MVKPLWKTVGRYLKKLEIDLPYDPAIPLLGMYPKEMKSVSQRDICAPRSWPRYSQKPRYGNNLCPSMDEWIKKT